MPRSRVNFGIEHGEDTLLAASCFLYVANTVAANSLSRSIAQAVPVAEPEWSGAHKGLCLYVARLLQPNWEQSVVAAQQQNNTLLSCRLPAAMLQALEDRLRSLEGFLREAQQRRRIKAGSRAPSLYGDPTTSGRLPDAGAARLAVLHHSSSCRRRLQTLTC